MEVAAVRPNVLVADDDPSVRVLLVALLQSWGYEVRQAGDGDEALQLIEAEAPDVAILDITMPKLDGFRLTQRLRGDQATRQTPILLLSTLTSGDDVARGLAAGADDYVRKPFHSEELRSRLETALRRADLVEELNDAAHADPLTGIPNRRIWDDQIVAELARAERFGEPLSAGLIDLDEFKAYNDGHGHQAGDQLLIDTALAWRAELREVDLLARYGGDEFGLLLPRCPLPEALQVLDRVCAATPHDQGCSGGVAQWDGSESAEELLHRADMALAEAKQSGRNRVAAAA